MGFPQTINSATPTGADSPSGGDDQLRGIKSFIVDVFGIADNVAYTTAAFAVTSAGVVTIPQVGFTGKNLALGLGTVTSSSSLVLDSTVTWNSGSQTFTAWKLNVTDTTSATASLLIDLQVGGASKFSVSKAGTVTFAGTIGAASGGTGLSAYAAGDLIYATGTTTLARRAIGTSGKILRSTGTAPDWSTATYPNTVSAGDLLLATGSNAIGSLAVGSDGKLVRSSGAAPAYSTFTIPDTFAAGDIPYASSANVLAGLAKGTANQLLGMNSGATAPEYKTIAGTTNQVTVTHGANSITLATPQDIHTAATPAFTAVRLGTNPAATGAVRLANNVYVIGRNAANSADVQAVGIDSSNRVLIGPGNTTVIRMGGVVRFDLDATTRVVAPVGADLWAT